MLGQAGSHVQAQCGFLDFMVGSRSRQAFKAMLLSSPLGGLATGCLQGMPLLIPFRYYCCNEVLQGQLALEQIASVYFCISLRITGCR